MNSITHPFNPTVKDGYQADCFEYEPNETNKKIRSLVRNDKFNPREVSFVPRERKSSREIKITISPRKCSL